MWTVKKAVVWAAVAFFAGIGAGILGIGGGLLLGPYMLAIGVNP
jgi:uncharacterized membrane protein YfcA